MNQRSSRNESKYSSKDALAYAEGILETVRTPLLVLGADLHIETANQRFFRTFDVTDQMSVGQSLFNFDDGQWDFPGLRSLVEDALSKKAAVEDREVEHQFPRLGRRQLHLSARHVRREQDQSDLILLGIEDVTEKRHAEEERRQMEARLTSLVDNLRDHAVFTVDTAGYITRWNDVAEHILQYSEQEAVGAHFSLVFTPEDVEQGKPQEELETARVKGRAEDERWHRRKNGDLFWAMGIVTPTTNRHGNHTGFSKILRDITDRKRTEERLRRQSMHLRMLWDSAAALLTASDPQSMMEEMFRKVSEHLDVDAYFNFVVDESDDYLRLVSCGGIPEDAARSIEQLEFGGNMPLQARPIVATHLQQSDYPTAELVKAYGIRTYACHPLIYENRLIGTLSFASRVVDAFEEEELAFFRTLAHYITVAYARLRLVEQLQEAHRRKDEFLAMLAHELRNPLAPIRSGLDLLAMDSDSHRETVKVMQDQVEHLVRLVDDLLDVSRIMRAKIELRSETVELSTLIKQSVQAIRPLVDGHQQELTVKLPEQPIWLAVDPVRLVQVLENLLNNASKYTDVGGRIELTVELQNHQAVIRVRDTGVGIEPELLPHVFELFTQSDNSLDRAQGGLGIGLTLVKRLVEMQGGTVSAHSDGLGHGSMFLVHLPAVEAVAEKDPATERPKAAASRRILVVDDNEGAAWMLSMLLNKLGDHRIETAHDGPTALVKIKETHPEIVLLDIGLPGMDGFEVGKAVRSIPELDDVLLIALTGYGQEEDRRKSQEAGFDEHLTKPPSVEQMRGVLSHPKLNRSDR